MLKATARTEGEASISFERRIAAAALVTAVAVLVAASLAFIFEQWNAEQRMLTRTNNAVVEMLAADAADALTLGDSNEAEQLFASLSNFPRVSSADLVDRRGVVVASYIRPAKAGAEPPQVDLWRKPVKAGGAQVGEVVLRTDRFKLANILPRYLAVGGALFFVAAGIALFLGRWLAAKLTLPVARLSSAMQEITGGKGDYDRRVEPMYDDEVGRLTVAFNALLGRLQVNDEALRAAMDELVEARDAAEAANVLKSHFLANMSHEIRTPLNGVLAMTQIMAMGELSASQRERLEVIHKSGDALLAVLNDILDLSKIEAGRMELDTLPFDTASTMRQAFAGFAGMAQEKGLAYALEIDPNAEGWRAGDAARVAQVVSNLISNAIKFTDKGQITVRVDGEGADGADGLKVAISDTGMGIAADKRSYLFTKFSQIDGSATRKYGGTGLGLAICRELVQLMGGAVDVESQLGEGSTFTIRLPLARVAHKEVEAPGRAAQTAAVIQEHEAEEERPLRVLAAEDNATNQLVLRTVMQTFEADLELVENGKLAVEAWERGNFDIILMDIQMPVMDGVTAVKTIRAAEVESGRARTPIIAVSANAMVHQVKEYLAAGMDAHVPKPIELVKLHAAMGAALAANDPEAAEEAA